MNKYYVSNLGIVYEVEIERVSGNFYNVKNKLGGEITYNVKIFENLNLFDNYEDAVREAETVIEHNKEDLVRLYKRKLC